MSVKLVFLLAVATSRRGSELQALSIAKGHIRWETSGVRLVPAVGFLTKNQTSSFNPPDIFVPSIGSQSGVLSDKLWCPVRALKWYLSRTKHLRGDNQQLFVTTTRPHSPATRDTIARWVVSAVKFANPNWQAPADSHVRQKLRAHDVRAISTSWAYFRGVPIADICKAACWKSPSTFSSCYLRDILQSEGVSGRTVLTTARSAIQRATSERDAP